MHYNNLVSAMWCLSLMSRNSDLLILRKCACSSSVYFLGMSKVPVLQNNRVLRWTNRRQGNKQRHLSHEGDDDSCPLLSSSQLSGFERNTFNDFFVSPNVHRLSLLFILEQICASKFAGFLCILIPGWTSLDVRYAFQAFKILISSLNSFGKRWQ